MYIDTKTTGINGTNGQSLKSLLGTVRKVTFKQEDKKID